MKNKIKISFFSFGVSFCLIGCGGGGSVSSTAFSPDFAPQANPSIATVQGVVSDGLIQGGTVWLDLNDNELKETNEPSATTDSLGRYSLALSEEVAAGKKVRCSGGIDLDTGQAFEGRFESVLDGGVEAGQNRKKMLNPLVTLKSKGVIEARLRQIFANLPTSDLDEVNPVEYPDLHRANVTIHTLANLLSSAQQVKNVDQAYQELASELPTSSGTLGELPLETILERMSSHPPDKCRTLAKFIGESVNRFSELDSSDSSHRQQLLDLQMVSQVILPQKLQRYAQGFSDGRELREDLNIKDLEAYIQNHGTEIQSLRQNQYDWQGSNLDNSSNGECPTERFLKPSQLSSELLQVAASSLEVHCQGEYLVVQSNGIPTFEVTRMTPNSLRNQSRSYYVPIEPEMASEVTEVPFLGPLAVTVTGLPIYAPNTAADLGYGDANLEGIVDECGGHVGPNGDYHFHARPGCPFEQASDLSSAIIGYAFDGFPIMAPYVCANEDCSELRKVQGSWKKCENGVCGSVPLKEVQSSWQHSYPSVQAAWDAHEYVEGSGDLDQCNGMIGPDGKYRYYATDTFPYNLGCYRGVVNKNINRLAPGWSDKDQVGSGPGGGMPPQQGGGQARGGQHPFPPPHHRVNRSWHHHPHGPHPLLHRD